jgi:hypothetical protein
MDAYGRMAMGQDLSRLKTQEPACFVTVTYGNFINTPYISLLSKRGQRQQQIAGHPLGLKNHHFKQSCEEFSKTVNLHLADLSHISEFAWISWISTFLVFCNAFLRSPPKPVLGSPTNMADSARASKRMRVVCLGRNPEKSLGSSSCGNQYDGRSRERICGCLIWRRFYPCKAAT